MDNSFIFELGDTKILRKQKAGIPKSININLIISNGSFLQYV